MKKLMITGCNGDIASALIDTIDKKYDIVGIDITSKKHSIDYIQCDLSTPESIDYMINNNLSNDLPEFESIIHLAGVYPNKSINDYSYELWNKIHNVNVYSIHRIIQSILLTKNFKLKNIILVSSTAGLIGSRDPAYSSSKSALIGLSKSLNKNLKKHNIRVNVVCPGLIDTQMSKIQTLEDKNNHVMNTLAGRMGTPNDVSNLITYLLDDESSYIWGNVIEVNGGMNK